MADRRDLARLGLAAVGGAAELPRLRAADCLHRAPEVGGRGLVGDVADLADQLAVGDLVEALTGELGVEALHVDAPGAVPDDVEPVLDLADQLLGAGSVLGGLQRDVRRVRHSHADRWRVAKEHHQHRRAADVRNRSRSVDRNIYFRLRRRPLRRVLRVRFLHRIRDERKFSGIDELKAQIERDTRPARNYFHHQGVKNMLAILMKLTELRPMLWTEDLMGTIGFYTDVLGSKATKRSKIWAGRRFASTMFRSCSRNRIQHTPYKKIGFTGTFYFKTDNVEAMWTKVKDKAKVCYGIENFEQGHA